MKVKELVEILQSLDGESEIIVQVDYQTTGKFLSGVFPAAARFDTDREGTRRVEAIGLSELDDNLRQSGYTEDDVLTDGEKVSIVHCWTSVATNE